MSQRTLNTVGKNERNKGSRLNICFWSSIIGVVGGALMSLSLSVCAYWSSGSHSILKDALLLTITGGFKGPELGVLWQIGLLPSTSIYKLSILLLLITGPIRSFQSLKKQG